MVKISVSIDVSDLKKAETFYVEALGCSKVRDQGGMSIISAGNCDIYLQEKKEGSKPIKGSDVVRSYERHWSPIHLDFITSDIENVVKKVIELGGLKEGDDSWDGGSIAYCVDPFGNGFCVINE